MQGHLQNPGRIKQYVSFLIVPNLLQQSSSLCLFSKCTQFLVVFYLFLFPSLHCFCPLFFFYPCHPEVVSVQSVFFWIIRWPWWLTTWLPLLRCMCWCKSVPVVHCGHIIQDICPHEQAQSPLTFFFTEGHSSFSGFPPTCSTTTFENWVCPHFILIYWFFTNHRSAATEIWLLYSFY